MTGGKLSWQDALAELRRERERVEIYLNVLRSNRSTLDAGTIERLAVIYGEAKAEYNGVIDGLVVALARREAAPRLSDLEARLNRGFKNREAFCKRVKQLVPARSGERTWVGEILAGGSATLMIAVVHAVWLRVRDDDVLTRKTIGTQLEAARWPEFDLGTPSA